MKKYVKDAWILKKERIAGDVVRLTVSNPMPDVEIAAGQFYGIMPSRGSEKLVRRPISVCEANQEEIVFMVKVLGKGTQELADMREGETMSIMGPLGNGFTVEGDKKALVIGGGIGIAPLVQLLKELEDQGQSNVRTMLGYRDQPYGLDQFGQYTNNLIAVSENGPAQHMGYATQFLHEALKTGAYDMVYACGPEAMLHCIQVDCESLGIPVQLSTERNMACGVGACLVCTCATKGGDYIRTCTEGPVFYGDEVTFDEAS